MHLHGAQALVTLFFDASVALNYLLVIFLVAKLMYLLLNVLFDVNVVRTSVNVPDT